MTSETRIHLIQGEKKDCCDSAIVTGSCREGGVEYVERTCDCGTAWVVERVYDFSALGRECL